MNETLWAKLLLRAVGILLIGLSGPDILQWIGAIISTRDQMSSWTAEAVGGYIVSALATGMQFAFGVYLVVSGRFVAALCTQGLDRSSVQSHVDGSALGVCGTCGQTLPGPQR